MRIGLTPSQTVGPFLHLGLPWADGPFAVPEGTPGAVRITGRIFDGAGQPVPDAIVETWQADPDGRFAHPDDPRGAQRSSLAGFRGFARCPTDEQGRYEILTVKPGPLPAPEGAPWQAAAGASGPLEAPHLNVSVFARGLLDRLVTRVYFPDEADANAADPVLNAIQDSRRGTLIAWQDGDGFSFDIHMQGENETVFFAL